MKYLKSYIWLIIILIVVLILEATSEVTLVECVGDIFNKGFEQYGVEDYIPLVIDDETKNHVCFLIGENKNLFLQSYQPLSSEKQFKKNKKLHNVSFDFKNQNFYILENKNKKELKALNNDVFDALLILNSDSNIDIKKLLIQNVDFKLNEPLISQIINCSNEERTAKLNILKNNISEVHQVHAKVMDDIVIDSIRTTYKSMGINVAKLQQNYIKRISLKMIIWIVIGFLTWSAIELIAAYCSAGVIKNIRSDLFKKVNSFSKCEVDKFSVSSLITRFTNDMMQINNFLFYLMDNGLFSLIFGGMTIWRAYKRSVEMSWIMVFIIAVMIVILWTIIYLAMPKFKIQQTLLDKINLITRENLSGILSIRAFNTQKFEEARFDKTNTELRSCNLFVERIMAAINPLICLVTNIGTVAVVLVGYKYILNFTLQVGDVVVYINYINFVIIAFILLSMLIIEFPRSQVSAKRILEVLDTQSSIVDKIDAVNEYAFKGELTFKNVSFVYPGATDYILKDVSFTAKPGQTTAIIGATGSGKSTITNLVPRLYDVTSGEILLDGINIKDISQHTLREQISYAPQNGALFKGTIESNVKYGNVTANYEEMCLVADIAKASDFINLKDGKFTSEISQGGTNVSGGQRQRLSIARAIMKKAKVYIFDDSFSALDFKTDLEVRSSLNEYLKDSTVIVIAQRIGTILNADQIIVLEEGRIVGKGTHKELIKNCKEYYDIASNQLPEDLLK